MCCAQKRFSSMKRKARRKVWNKKNGTKKLTKSKLLNSIEREISLLPCPVRKKAIDEVNFTIFTIWQVYIITNLKVTREIIGKI